MEDFASSHFVITSIKVQIDALKKKVEASRPDVDILEVVSLIDTRSPGAPEFLNSSIHAPVVLLNHEGADEKSRPVESMGAVHPHYVQGMLGNVLPVNDFLSV